METKLFTAAEWHSRQKVQPKSGPKMELLSTPYITAVTTEIDENVFEHSLTKHTHTNTHTHTLTHSHACTYTHTHTHSHSHIHTHTHARTRTHTHTHTHTLTHTHTHTSTAMPLAQAPHTPSGSAHNAFTKLSTLLEKSLQWIDNWHPLDWLFSECSNRKTNFSPCSNHFLPVPKWTKDIKSKTQAVATRCITSDMQEVQEQLTVQIKWSIISLTTLTSHMNGDPFVSKFSTLVYAKLFIAPVIFSYHFIWSVHRKKKITGEKIQAQMLYSFKIMLNTNWH